MKNRDADFRAGVMREHTQLTDRTLSRNIPYTAQLPHTGLPFPEPVWFPGVMPGPIEYGFPPMQAYDDAAQMHAGGTSDAENVNNLL